MTRPPPARRRPAPGRRSRPTGPVRGPRTRRARLQRLQALARSHPTALSPAKVTILLRALLVLARQHTTRWRSGRVAGSRLEEAGQAATPHANQVVVVGTPETHPPHRPGSVDSGLGSRSPRTT